ncbi:MAG: hypothetical protein V1790_05590 [Planctomycetota bacterium]
MPSPAYETHEDEYWYNVSPQDDLPLAGSVDLDIDLQALSQFFVSLSALPDIGAASEHIRAALIANPILFSYARQFVGLSDKRAYLDLSYLASRTAHPTQSNSLSGCHPWTLSRHPMAFFLRLLSGSKGRQVQIATADMVACYLVRQGLYDAAKGFAGMSEALMELVYTRLIAPKEYQQKAAKRRGHGCEAALAAVLETSGVSLLPPNKATNPMGASDPHLNLDTMSVTTRSAGSTHAFDMLIMNRTQRLAVAIQSLIHSSDPGQYGVDKSNETVAIANKIAQWNASRPSDVPVELWGLVDGVGFSENKPDTINKLLRHFHHFVQIRTLYKAPLRLHHLGHVCIRAVSFSNYYDPEDIASIRRLYVPPNVAIIASADDLTGPITSIPCGEGVVYL